VQVSVHSHAIGHVVGGAAASGADLCVTIAHTTDAEPLTSRRPAFKTCNQPDDVIGHDDAESTISRRLLGPQPVADRLARQIDDGIDFASAGS